MNMLVHVAEKQDANDLSLAAAFIRSAFEDVHHMRRVQVAGFNSHKLELRPDMTERRLLSKQEEKDCNIGRRNYGRGRGGGGGHNQSGSGSYSGSGGRGKNSNFRGNRSSSSSSFQQGEQSQNWRGRSSERQSSTK